MRVLGASTVMKELKVSRRKKIKGCISLNRLQEEDVARRVKQIQNNQKSI